jgi:diadenosine tetraphosphatase ApaH/serine/threonine PP2A family protein phosphatase
MLVAVVSDVHSNLHALEAVLAALERDSPAAIWCLGDVVGYGPRPDECCRIVEERTSLCLAGNHDLGVRGDVPLDEFSPAAVAAALWTRGVLGDRSRAFLERLVPTATRDGVELYHASPRDPLWEYVITDETAGAALEATAAPVVLVGHSHVPLAVTGDGDRVTGGHVLAGTDVELAGRRWLLNPGSVGQPRDGDPRASYLLLDLAAERASFRRVDYPIAETQAEITTAGLPPLLGERLSSGA